MSKRLVGIKEIVANKHIPWTEQTFRKRKKQDLIDAGCLFLSILPRDDMDGKTRRVWQYWTTEALLERYIIALGSRNKGIV